jgi:hypothetical protein
MWPSSVADQATPGFLDCRDQWQSLSEDEDE